MFKRDTSQPAAVTLYTRKGCHLCDEARAEIDRLRAKAEFELETVDIDSDAGLQARFNDEVPVVFINGRKAFKYRVEPREFLSRLRTFSGGRR